jgi:hypothetical protein
MEMGKGPSDAGEGKSPGYDRMLGNVCQVIKVDEWKGDGLAEDTEDQAGQKGANGGHFPPGRDGDPRRIGTLLLDRFGWHVVHDRGWRFRKQKDRQEQAKCQPAGGAWGEADDDDLSLTRRSVLAGRMPAGAGKMRALREERVLSNSYRRLQ